MARMSLLSSAFSSKKKQATEPKKVLFKCLPSTRLQVDTFVTLLRRETVKRMCQSVIGESAKKYCSGSQKGERFLSPIRLRNFKVARTFVKVNEKARLYEKIAKIPPYMDICSIFGAKVPYIASGILSSSQRHVLFVCDQKSAKKKEGSRSQETTNRKTSLVRLERAVDIST
jgi:restriction endonuclease